MRKLSVSYSNEIDVLCGIMCQWTRTLHNYTTASYSTEAIHAGLYLWIRNTLHPHINFYCTYTHTSHCYLSLTSLLLNKNKGFEYVIKQWNCPIILAYSIILSATYCSKNYSSITGTFLGYEALNYKTNSLFRSLVTIMTGGQYTVDERLSTNIYQIYSFLYQDNHNQNCKSTTGR